MITATVRDLHDRAMRLCDEMLAARKRGGAIMGRKCKVYFSAEPLPPSLLADDGDTP